MTDIKKDIDKIQNTRIYSMKNDIYPAMTSGGIYGQTSDGVWHKALTVKGWQENFKYDHTTMRLKRLSTGRGFDKWINCTDKYMKSFIQQTIDQQVKEAVEEFAKKVEEKIEDLAPDMVSGHEEAPFRFDYVNKDKLLQSLKLLVNK